MAPANLASWSNFFTTEATAAATLAGLLFVAVSINLERILAFAHLPGRASEVLWTFVAILLISSVGLIPRQTDLLFGVEIIVIAIPLVLSSVANHWLSHRSYKGHRTAVVMRLVLSYAAAVSWLLAGTLLLLGDERGLFALATGMCIYIIVGVLNCWVLLVEILR